MFGFERVSAPTNKRKKELRQITTKMSLSEEAKVSMAEPEPMTRVGDQKSPTPLQPFTLCPKPEISLLLTPQRDSPIDRHEKRTDSDYKGSLSR